LTASSSYQAGMTMRLAAAALAPQHVLDRGLAFAHAVFGAGTDARRHQSVAGQHLDRERARRHRAHALEQVGCDVGAGGAEPMAAVT
jgi:hypothetical protein